MSPELDVEVVGREFVRQYYTILNERPDCLHQFFTQDSSYIHGGVEKPGEERPACRGQSLIHQKILSLGFRDCHTKIRQIDCQKTVGNAVLVQVSGELSNNGQPMRRFMQSFVLVQQTPKNFYVHNDIFRYQDEVFIEESSSNYTAHQATAPPQEQNIQEIAHGNQQIDPKVGHIGTPEANYEATQASGHQMPHDPEKLSQFQHQQFVGREGTGGHVGMGTSPLVAAVVANQVKSEQPGAGHQPHHRHLYAEVDGSTDKMEKTELTEGPQQGQEQNPSSSSVDAPPSQESEEKNATENKKNETFQTPVQKTSQQSSQQQQTQQQPPQQQQQQQQQPSPPAPKTFSWASMASKNVTPHPTTTPNQSKPQAAVKPERKAELQAGSQSSGGGPRQGQGQQIHNKQRINSAQTPQSTSSSSGLVAGGSGGEKKGTDGEDPGSKPLATIPDNQQLFIGNLPYNINENELRNLFENYGTVINIKINRKGNNRELPYFGFVAFSSPEAVAKAMSSKPIMLNGKRRINIEEKKDQSGGGFRRGGGGISGVGGGGGGGRLGFRGKSDATTAGQRGE